MNIFICRWFREKYRNDELVEEEVNPLDMDEYGKPNNTRVTISGGTLIINDPHTVTDRGRYFCKAYNELNGRKHEIRSQSVSIAFGFIGEFILRRTDEFGSENWGKAISCDPPQYFPDVKFYWARDYFPNFVEEDRRVMVSYDGNLYFSSLEKIDQVSNPNKNFHTLKESKRIVFFSPGKLLLQCSKFCLKQWTKWPILSS